MTRPLTIGTKKEKKLSVDHLFPFVQFWQNVVFFSEKWASATNVFSMGWTSVSKEDVRKLNTEWKTPFKGAKLKWAMKCKNRGGGIWPDCAELSMFVHFVWTTQWFPSRPYASHHILWLPTRVKKTAFASMRRCKRTVHAYCWSSVWCISDVNDRRTQVKWHHCHSYSRFMHPKLFETFVNV